MRLYLLHQVCVATAATRVRRNPPRRRSRVRGERVLQLIDPKKEKKASLPNDYTQDFNTVCIMELNRRAAIRGSLDQIAYAEFLSEYCAKSPIRGPSCITADDRK